MVRKIKFWEGGLKELCLKGWEGEGTKRNPMGREEKMRTHGREMAVGRGEKVKLNKERIMGGEERISDGTIKIGQTRQNKIRRRVGNEKLKDIEGGQMKGESRK